MRRVHCDRCGNHIGHDFESTPLGWIKLAATTAPNSAFNSAKLISGKELCSQCADALREWLKPTPQEDKGNL